MSVLIWQEQRANVAAQANNLLRKAASEGRGLTVDERQAFDRLHAVADELRGDIERNERQAALKLNTPVDNDFRSWLLESSVVSVKSASRRAAAFDVYPSQLTVRLGKAPKSVAEARALSHITIQQGGALVAPTRFLSGVESAMLSFDTLREHATIIRTDGGGDLFVGTSNDTNNEGELTAEAVAANRADPSFGSVALFAHEYSSREVIVPFTLAQDASVDFDAFIGAALGERIGRIQARHFCNGTGSGQPSGLLTSGAVDSGIVTASAATISFSELVNLEHSVNAAYRPNARYMGHDSVLKVIKLLTDSSGQPVWRPSPTGGPDLVNGRPFIVNQAMPEFAAGAKALVYGDLSRYHIRDVSEVVFLRLNERYVEQGRLGYLMLMRSDGALVNAGGNPIKFATIKT